MCYLATTFDNLLKASDTVYSSYNLANILLHICKTGNFLSDVRNYCLLANPVNKYLKYNKIYIKGWLFRKCGWIQAIVIAKISRP